MNDSATFILAAVSVAVAAAGWYITHQNQIRLDRRKARLELVNKQLDDFYGPLFVATRAGRITYQALLKKLGRSAVNPRDDFLNDRDKKEWVIWLKHVFTPLNNLMENIIINDSYLIKEVEMPQCLLDYVTHAAAYKAVLAKWEENDYTTLFSLIDFPAELDDYITKAYRELKHEQAQLLGEVRRSWQRREKKISKVQHHPQAAA